MGVATFFLLFFFGSGVVPLFVGLAEVVEGAETVVRKALKPYIKASNIRII